MSRSTVPRPGSFSVNAFFDTVFFVFGGVATVWLAVIVLTESFTWGPFLVVFFVLFWAVLAYLALPRLHRILTRIYVPGYFIGRARTSDGLLGDPVNLALLGDASRLHAVMRAAGWTRADEVTLRSSVRIVTSTLLRRSYHEAPVSPLHLFGRRQDVAYQQEVRGTPSRRHHVRFWRCPEGWMLPGGHRVDWVAAGSFDRSVGLSLFTLQVTHRIDADIDVERDHVVETITAAEPAVVVRVIRDFSTGYHSRNGGGDSIRTDGDLPVLDLRGTPAAPAPTAADVFASTVRDPAAGPPLVEGPAHRPIATVAGAALMALRVVAALLFFADTGLNWRAVLAAESGTAASAVESAAVMILLVVLSAFVLVYLVLTWLVFRGSNGARITAMALSGVAIVAAAVDFFHGGPQVSLRNNLLGLPLDILVLLALSAESARDWARRPRGPRRA